MIAVEIELIDLKKAWYVHSYAPVSIEITALNHPTNYCRGNFLIDVEDGVCGGQPQKKEEKDCQ